MERHACQLCGQVKDLRDLYPASAVRDNVSTFIAREHPDWNPNQGYICHDDLNAQRADYVRAQLEEDRGQLTRLDLQVIESLEEQDLLTRDVNKQFEADKTFGEALADKVADFGGSWTFIMLFFAALMAWMLTNTLLLRQTAFDPYPYILLNLCLSCLASIQAPIIMMSQNRQEAKDRLRSEQDYVTNLKAELEIRSLTLKIDQLLTQQWQHLVEIQQIQTDILREMSARLP
ncbi:MAG: DUF1003 domain-containing protein [Candidatus Eremiobacteraeota bacterium]|nr:DUF1003 domain-containing protein [Candidatus Eremiobacteraeota bacterium]